MGNPRSYEKKSHRPRKCHRKGGVERGGGAEREGVDLRRGGRGIRKAVQELCLNDSGSVSGCIPIAGGKWTVPYSHWTAASKGRGGNDGRDEDGGRGRGGT